MARKTKEEAQELIRKSADEIHFHGLCLMSDVMMADFFCPEDPYIPASCIDSMIIGFRSLHIEDIIHSKIRYQTFSIEHQTFLPNLSNPALLH